MSLNAAVSEGGTGFEGEGDGDEDDEDELDPPEDFERLMSSIKSSADLIGRAPAEAG